MQIKRVLVPVDGSAGSQSALSQAIALHDGHPAEIVLVLALEPIHLRIGAQVTAPGANVRMIADEQRMIAERHLAKLATQLEEQGITARTVVDIGAADEVILKTAKKLGCDLIVMSSHARTGLAHLLLGSITEKVLRRAECPVLTIRGYDKKKRGSR